jgi:hypothetical protein
MPSADYFLKENKKIICKSVKNIPCLCNDFITTFFVVVTKETKLYFLLQGLTLVSGAD